MIVWAVAGAVGLGVLWCAVVGARAIWTRREMSARGAVDSDGRVRTDGAGIEMVVAYVRPSRLDAVKRGLAEASAPSVTVSTVFRRGREAPRTGQYRGQQYSVDLHQKIKVECVVADVPTDRVVDAIADTAYTGDRGDGTILVRPVTGARQIRTGDRGVDGV